MNRTNSGILATIFLVALFIGSGGRVGKIRGTPQGTPENEARAMNKGTPDQRRSEKAPAKALTRLARLAFALRGGPAYAKG